MLLVEKIRDVMQIGCEPYQVTKPLAKTKTIATAYYSSILITLRLPSEEKDFADIGHTFQIVIGFSYKTKKNDLNFLFDISPMPIY